jgi:molybdopterin synthase sulfur carrier subunit
MQIQLKFFASLREAVGTGSESLVIPAEVKTAGQVRELLRHRGGVWAEALAEGRALRIAVNQQMADASAPLTEGCELAFFPPVTGG